MRAFTSSNRRTFPIAITRLVGKGRNQFDLPVAEWRDNSLGQDDDADRDTVPQQGNAEHGAIARVTRHAQRVFLVR